MNTRRNRTENKTIILGSGESILNLTQDEIKYINNCTIVIAVNKYMAFYDLIGIIPTHVYFHDITGREMFDLILQKCLNDNLENITIITNPIFKLFTYKNKTYRYVNFLKYFKEFITSLLLIRIGKIVIINYIKAFKKLSTYRIPTSWKIISIRVSKWNKGGKWAKGFSEPIFHYRGSLTSALNIATIIAPKRDIYLVGNDFNGGRYFYEDHLNSTNINWKDFTYNSTKKTELHYSFQNVKGTSIIDKFPLIINKITKQGGRLFCINKESLLVKDADVHFKPLP